ncbi:MAG: NusA-like transcription termination signal-binding factor [Thaumarchaeota archaeon]|nr:NusA-like transcription termination signal-binding factor [Candidatus Calditenuaceae archaeon]MDW8187424.1 NusA-like transcription termination signal-binding factor [Nitrososphaerota archaeon]
MSEGGRQSVKITESELQYISFFQQVTNVQPVDCIVIEDMIVYVVNAGDVGKAVGKRGTTVQELRNIQKKRIKVVEFSSDPKKFIANALQPANVAEVELFERKGRLHARVKVPEEEKGKAIGKGGKNLRAAVELARRHFGVERIVIQ